MKQHRNIIARVRNVWQPGRKLPVVSILVCVFAVVGVVLINLSHAATSSIPLEAESAQPVGNAAKLADPTASGGYDIKFGANTQGGGGGSGDYTFDDEFDGTALDTNAWIALDRGPDEDNQEVQCYQSSNVSVSGGYLQLTSKKQSVSKSSTCPNGSQYSSSMVQWKDFNFKYGTLSFRAKQVAGDGAWTAQWLLGADCQKSNPVSADNVMGCNWPHPGSDETDIDEWKASKTSPLQSSVDASANFYTCTPSVSDATKNWHDYSITWKPGNMVWTIDGEETCNQSEGIPSNPMFMIIGLAMGAQGGNINNGSLPWTMLIDYVRVSAQ